MTGLYWDSQGVCFFDDAPNPYLAAIVEILHAQGEQAWILVKSRYASKI